MFYITKRLSITFLENYADFLESTFCFAIICNNLYGVVLDKWLLLQWSSIYIELALLFKYVVGGDILILYSIYEPLMILKGIS